MSLKTVLREISDKVSPKLGGIDWLSLEATLGMSRDKIVYHVDPSKDPSQVGLFMYQVAIKQAYERAELALKDVVLSWSVADNPATRENEVVQAMTALKDVRQDIGDVSTSVLAALDNNLTFLTNGEVLEMQREQYRAMISYTYMTSLYSYLVHANGIMQYQEVPAEIIIQSADTLVKSLNALAVLGENGALDSLKLQAMQAPPAAAPAPTSGLGLAPIAWAAIIALSVTLLVGIIAWCVVETERQAAINQMVKDICEDAFKSGDQEKYGRCIELVKLNMTATTSKPSDQLVDIGKTALMIGAAFALIWFTPKLVQMLPDKKAATA